jgi:hypothetical protein
MMRDREPTRLTELRDEELGGLRRALTAARRMGPDAGARARIAAGVTASVNDPAHAQPPRTSPPGSFGPLSLKAGLAGLAGLTVVSAIVMVATRGPARAPVRASAPGPVLVVAAAPAAAVPAERPAAPPTASAAVTAAEPSRLPARPAAPRHAAARAAAASPTTTTRRAPPPTEGELLRRAQESLHVAPARALELVQEHAALYPSGALAQERDVIGIEALMRLGRADQARASAQRFLEQHPGSPHRSHVEALMGRAAP